MLPTEASDPQPDNRLARRVALHHRALFGHYDKDRNAAVPGILATGQRTAVAVNQLRWWFMLGALGYVADHLHIPGFTSWLSVLSGRG